jgi:hypothetical protein
MPVATYTLGDGLLTTGVDALSPGQIKVSVEACPLHCRERDLGRSRKSGS